MRHWARVYGKKYQEQKVFFLGFFDKNLLFLNLQTQIKHLLVCFFIKQSQKAITFKEV
jgi:hypothetical protein